MDAPRDEQQRLVLLLRFGTRWQERSRAEVAVELGMTEEEVTKLERSALQALRAAALEAAALPEQQGTAPVRLGPGEGQFKDRTRRSDLELAR